MPSFFINEPARRGFLGLWCRVFGILLMFSRLACADLEAGIEALARRDYAVALQAFKPLAMAGDVAAQINLGNLYMKGLGVEQNYVEAEHWYRQAAERNERLAQSKLGILYYYGLGVPRDVSEAARWFAKAARQGEPSAQTVLATLYAQGEGVEPDLVEAYYWYTLAMAQGSEEAKRGRDSLVEDMTPGQIDAALARLAATRRSLEEERALEADSMNKDLATQSRLETRAGHRVRKIRAIQGRKVAQRAGKKAKPAAAKQAQRKKRQRA